MKVCLRKKLLVVFCAVSTYHKQYFVGEDFLPLSKFCSDNTHDMTMQMLYLYMYTKRLLLILYDVVMVVGLCGQLNLHVLCSEEGGTTLQRERVQLWNCLQKAIQNVCSHMCL